jgi:hypothetical protein
VRARCFDLWLNFPSDYLLFFPYSRRGDFDAPYPRRKQLRISLRRFFSDSFFVSSIHIIRRRCGRELKEMNGGGAVSFVNQNFFGFVNEESFT